MKILFVDSEVQVLRGIERILDVYADERQWEMEFVTSGQAALGEMRQSPCDVLVSEMRIADMQGGQLLEMVSQEFPKTVRIVLSGQADKESVYKTVKPMHQYMSKPCEANTIRETIERACSLSEMLSCRQLSEFIGSITSLPSLPNVYRDVVAELESSNSSLSSVGEIISRDLAMTAKVLQISNSSAFGLSRKIVSASQAATVLGLETIKALVLTFGVFREFDNDKLNGFSMDSAMNHALQVGMCADKICKYEDVNSEMANEAMTAGMLHDIGKLVVAAGNKKQFREIRELVKSDGLSQVAAEKQVLGTSHCGVGAYMLSIWGLPQSLIEAIAFHHEPNAFEASSFTSVTAVAAANVLCHQANSGADAQTTDNLMEHLTQLGMESKLQEWSEACMAEQPAT